jgi:hypothetical protein
LRNTWARASRGVSQGLLCCWALRNALAGLKGPRGKDRDASLIKLTLNGTGATISRPFLPGGEPAAARTLPCDHDGGCVEIGFELRFLKDALGVFGSTVRFALSGPREPALITSDETSSCRGSCRMPRRAQVGSASRTGR